MRTFSTLYILIHSSRNTLAISTQLWPPTLHGNKTSFQQKSSWTSELWAVSCNWSTRSSENWTQTSLPTFRAKVVFSGHKQLVSDNLSLWTKRSDVHDASTSSVCSAYQMQSLHACNTFPLGTETLSTQRPCFFPLDLTSDVVARTLMPDRPTNQITDLLSTASQISQWAAGAGLKCMRSHTNIDWLL